MITIEKIDYEKFRPFLESLDLVSTSSEWAKFVDTNLGGKPCYFGVFENGHLDFIIPAFKTTAGELIGVTKLYTEIIAYGNDQKMSPLADILAFFKKNKEFSSVKFLICPILDPGFITATDKNGLGIRGVSHVLKLETADENEILAKTISHKTRNQITASNRRGAFKIKIDDDISKFFQLYLASIKRLKSIPKEFVFFENLKKSFGGNLRIISAYCDNELAGANLVLIKNGYLHLMFNASEERFFKYYVNDLLYWEVIKLGLARGVKIFDFGPSSVKDKSHQHFKEGFGAVPVPIFEISFYNSMQKRIYDFVSKRKRNFLLRAKRFINF